MKVRLSIHSRLKAKLVGKVRDATNAVMESAVSHAIDALSNIADSELHGTAQAYKDGLRNAVTAKNGTLKIELTGVAKDLEVGYPARDMKKELLASPSAKQGKNGKYIDIPFKHKMSEAPTEIKAKAQAAIRAENSRAKLENRDPRNPMRVIGNLPGKKNVQQRFNARGGTKQVEVQHKTSVFSNMIRTKLGSNQASYNTIRRISANSDPQSWHHPGFKGIHALKRIEKDLRQMLRKELKRELQRNK